MKKTIFGSALMICGMIAGCAEYLSHNILVAAPNVSIVRGNIILSWGGPILFVVGLILCIIGLTSNNENNIQQDSDE